MAYRFTTDPPSGDSPSNRDLEVILKLARQEALARGANAHEADDVAQQVMIRLWRTWREPHVVRARLRGEKRWHGYVRSAARNVHIDEIRKYQRRIGREDRYVDHPAATLPARPHVVRPVPPHPFEAEAYLGRELLVGLLDDLPQKQREVALAVFVNELAIPEVAEQLGLQAQSVRKRLRTAQRTIRQMLIQLGELIDEQE